MRILVFGAEGMLGSALMRHVDCYGTTRQHTNNPHILAGIDITDQDDLRRAFDWASPQVAVNCAGIVKSECANQDPARVSAVNGEAPHKIAEIAAGAGCKVVHVSTDCVFDGSRGSRTEEDLPDATDLYGQSKSAGELRSYEHCVTLRTSFIGHDLVRRRGLLEWLLSHEGGAVQGFVRALWSGLSTPELAYAILLASKMPHLSGLYHVSGPSISKADLLEVLVRELGIQCHIERVDGDPIDRTLDGSRFIEATGYAPPSWVDMAKEL